MTALRKILRYTLRTMAAIILFLLLYAFLAWALPYYKPDVPPVKEKPDIVIYVQSNGVHTDLVLPLKTEYIDWEKLFPYQHFDNVYQGFNYVSIGWGDKGFFLDTPTWADLKFSTAFNAVFGLSSTAMHVTYKYNEPKCGEKCRKLTLSKRQYLKMIRFILSSFRIEDRAPVHIDHKGYTQQDTFYEAKGTYSLFQTCNVWTGNALRFSDVKMGIWTPFDFSVLDQLE